MYRTVKICTQLAVAMIAAVVTVHAQSLPAKFQELLTQNNMQFTVPADFAPTAIIENDNVQYDFAIRSRSKKMEIRYLIVPINKNQSNKNAAYEQTLVIMAAVISNGTSIQPNHYPPRSAQKEFGADAGCTGMVSVNATFGKGYKTCLLSVIHKNDVADGYVFYLFDDKEDLIDVLADEKTFHALRFK